MLNNSVIPALKNPDELCLTVTTKSDTVFLLKSNILNLKKCIDNSKSMGKKLFVHFDMIDGIGKDECGIEYAAKMGAHGIISTKANIIKFARAKGLYTVQRFFILDSRSVETALENIHLHNPDMIELMPGIAPRIIEYFSGKVQSKIIAGGLIESKDDIMAAFEKGATAVSTTKRELWNIKI